MTKQQKRINKYNYIMNYTGDSQLARQARDWNDDRIKQELGFIIPNRKVKRVAPSTQKRYMKQYQDYLENRQYTTPDDYWKWIKIPKLKRPKGRGIDPRISKRETWKKWSVNNNRIMPRYFLSTARRLNREKGFDPNDTYGFIVMYNAYMYNETPEYIQSIMSYQTFNHEIYTLDIKH